MKLWEFDYFFDPIEKKWLCPCFVLTDEKGRVSKISDKKESAQKWTYSQREKITGDFVPSLVNAHCHSFQYAMVGMSENIPFSNQNTAQKTDNFWSWRERMYQIALEISPETLHLLAQFLYGQMLKLGYHHVVEFHYLHKNPKGQFYDNPTLMGECLIEAAKQVGMGLTLVPVYYKQGGFGAKASSRQRRFIFEGVDEYLKLIEAYRKKTDANHQIFLGGGVHSLRAASAQDIREIYKHFADHLPEAPFHLHVAEQTKEVSDCLDFYKKKPVEWVLEELSDLENFKNLHLVHATHITETEMKDLIKKNTNVVLCPSTEGNLGDGFFPIKKYAQNFGSWAIGSDSCMGLNPFEELRWLDYGERLNSKKRNILVREDEKNTVTDCLSGEQALLSAFLGGRRAAGISSKIMGQPLSGLAVDHPLISSCDPSYKLSTLVYGLDSQTISHVLSSSRLVVCNGSLQVDQPSKLALQKSLTPLRSSL